MKDGLSQWPGKFIDRDPTEDTPEIVAVIFEDWPEEMAYISCESDKAIGLAESESTIGESPVWIPKGQIEGDIPKVGEWIETIRIPRWLADRKELDYESFEG